MEREIALFFAWLCVCAGAAFAAAGGRFSSAPLSGVASYGGYAAAAAVAGGAAIFCIYALLASQLPLSVWAAFPLAAIPAAAAVAHARRLRRARRRARAGFEKSRLVVFGGGGGAGDSYDGGHYFCGRRRGGALFLNMFLPAIFSSAFCGVRKLRFAKTRRARKGRSGCCRCWRGRC